MSHFIQQRRKNWSWNDDGTTNYDHGGEIAMNSELKKEQVFLYRVLVECRAYHD